MNSRHKSPRDKSPRDRSSNKQRKAEARKQRATTVASEVTETVLREEAPPSPPPVVVAPKTLASEPPSPASAPKPVARQERESTPAPAPQPVRKQAAAPIAPAAMPKPPQQVVEGAVKIFERSFEAAGAGAIAVNRKLIDIARQNMTSGLDLAKDLAKAKSPLEFARLQMMFWDERMKALAAQAEQLRALSAELVAKANEPIREHVRRSLNGKAA